MIKNTAGRTTITLNPDQTEEKMRETIADVETGLKELNIPQGQITENVIIVGAAIPEDQVARFQCLPWVQSVVIERNDK